MNEEAKDKHEIDVTREIDDLAAAKVLKTLAKASKAELPLPVHIVMEEKEDGSLESKMIVTNNPHAPDAISASIDLASQFRQARADKRKGK